MVWRAVTDEQWALMKEQLPQRKRCVQGALPRQMTASASRACSGSYGRAPRGASDPQGMVRRLPSTAD
jgi:hypothetical protein